MSDHFTMEEEILRGYILNWLRAAGPGRIPRFLPEASTKSVGHYMHWLSSEMSGAIFDAIARGEMIAIEGSILDAPSDIGKALIHAATHMIEAKRVYGAVEQRRDVPAPGARGWRPGLHDAMLDATSEELEQIAIGTGLLRKIFDEHPDEG